MIFMFCVLNFVGKDKISVHTITHPFFTIELGRDRLVDRKQLNVLNKTFNCFLGIEHGAVSYLNYLLILTSIQTKKMTQETK